MLAIPTIGENLATDLRFDSRVRARLRDELAEPADERHAQKGEEGRRAKLTQQGNQQAWMQTQDVGGSVAAMSPNSLTVRSGDKGDVRLQVSDSTAINLDGRTASMKEIVAGSDVRASYGVVDGQTIATRLDVTSSKSNANASSTTK